eukprot:11998139-Heterocapsa_arctica.AAC.1
MAVRTDQGPQHRGVRHVLSGKSGCQSRAGAHQGGREAERSHGQRPAAGNEDPRHGCGSGSAGSSRSQAQQGM